MEEPAGSFKRKSARTGFGWIHGLTDRIVRPPRIVPLTGVRRAIPHWYVDATASRTNTVQWRTDNPVRPPERTSSRPVFGWIHGLTDRIVRPPHILPLTGVRRAISAPSAG